LTALRQRLAPFFELQDVATARWLPMEGLRGFAVGLVFFVHYATLAEPFVLGGDRAPALWLSALHELGNVGVDLFFVLSGFLIYKACIQRPLDIRRYAYRRVERIYPTFLVVLAIYLALMLLMPSASKLPDGAAAQALYIAANVLLLPGMLSITPIILVAWSLSYEAFYYILAPLAVAALRMRAWQAGQRFAFFLAVYLVMIGMELAGLGTHFRLSMFLGGMALYEFAYHLRGVREGQADWPRDAASLALVALAFAYYVALADAPVAVPSALNGALPAFTRTVALNVAFVTLVYRSVFTPGLAAGLFSWTPLRWLGNMSYSFYLLHGLALQAFFLLFGKLMPVQGGGAGLFLLLLAPAFAASLALTLPIYLLVEKPLSLSPTAKPARGKLDNTTQIEVP
jgi:peptidoglycan/LPS O-acetylase OafA/YrhL